ncbi:transcription elongation factor GreA [Mycoplasma phocimorsus]|uniref:Transcription elongation factor GreA n=1 Tax=Mycoplasma phocimorsus TaxID=3045839 RepID=A0AAJ1UVX2_9MOLU|nr:transcription elongation factor GreA [Mycoplasma phocimorsus]MDJ1645989.1 transcription elongation factor GreA [Mycoplasma phocimorsus]MDJ1646269.1 transcription elongation factor GreA [Mycoplasma phocimorsus]MDJ1646873.1 transcription elongation factor GreA [Mycoplasma phocimorsus]MDJ1647840.1 transcription elongation factor GreA [Mycoplasma phocimorsus]MDJ1648459.1 transcription elongation factor GreA [Mycoplasma phocimorsus]
MAKDNKMLLTQEGYDKLQNELKNLIDVERPAVIEEIKEARELGDLSENAEYDAARDRQAKIESRILEIENILQNAEVIKSEHSEHITIGSFVKIKRLDNEKEIEFQIVGAIDTDPLNKKISNESPLALAVLGHRIGEVIEVDAPTKYSVEIINISFE